ncbi:MAG: RNA polymerase sigma factor [Phycisphaerae bacterium]
MTALAATPPGDIAGLLQSIDLPRVRCNQGWVLRLMRRDGPALVRLLWRMLGREQDVLDAYQESICKLIAQFERDGRVPHRGYVFRTAMNVALDARRRRRVRDEHRDAVGRQAASGKSGPASRDPSERERVEALRQAIASLPARLRDVVVLRDLAEMSYCDVARALGLTAGTARVYRRQAIVELSSRLSE